MHQSIEEIAERLHALVVAERIELLRDGEPLMGIHETAVLLALAAAIIGPEAETLVVEEPTPPAHPRTQTDTVELTPELLGLLRRVSGA